MTTFIPPWEQIDPSAGPRLFQEGFGQGAGVIDSAIAAKQSQERLDISKQQAAVDQSLAKQKQAMAYQSAARTYQAMQSYQDAIRSGMDPGRAALIYGPSMSGGRMTGYSPLFNAYEKANAPSSTSAPFQLNPPGMEPRNYPVPQSITAKTVVDESGAPIGHQLGNRFIPIPKTPAPKMADEDKMALQNINRELDQLDMAYIQPRTGTVTEAQKRAIIAKRSQLQQQLSQIQAKYQQGPQQTQPDVTYPAPPSNAPAPSPRPLPDSEAQLQKGLVYQTKYGPATWSGTNFVTQ